MSFGETVPTRHLGLDLNFVPLESCNPGVGEFFPVPYNHMDICKPENKKSILFRSQTLHTIVVWSLFYPSRPFEILEQNSFPAGGTICNSIQFLKNRLFFSFLAADAKIEYYFSAPLFELVFLPLYRKILIQCWRIQINVILIRKEQFWSNPDPNLKTFKQNNFLINLKRSLIKLKLV